MKNIQIRLEDAEYAQVEQKMKAVKAASIQEFGKKALLTYGAPVPAGTYAGANKEAHDLLETVLTSGDQNKAEWITGNLKTFAEGISLQRKLADLDRKAAGSRTKPG